MKVAYIFKTNMASTFQLATMILPQLEKNTHGVEVVGMFFFDENTHILRKGNDTGERLNKIAKERNQGKKRLVGWKNHFKRALFSSKRKKMSLKKLVHFCISPSSALLDLTSFI